MLERLLLMTTLTFSPVEMSLPKAMVSQFLVAQANSPEYEAQLEFYRDIAEKMSNAIHKGETGYEKKHSADKRKYHTLCEHRLPFKRDGDQSQFNVRFQYVCGPKGGAGTIRGLFYLEPYDWYSVKAIDNLKLWLFSTEETRVSAKIYELNVNHAHKTTVHESITERMLLGDYIVEQVGTEPVFTLLSKLKIKKSDIKKFLKAAGIIGEVLDYWEEEEIKSIATKIAGDHVWLTEFNIRGFGKADENVFLYPNTVRAPKLFEIEIIEGAKYTVGFALKGESRVYALEKGGLIQVYGVRKSEVSAKAALNIDFYLHGSVKDEKLDWDEISNIKAREIERREFCKDEIDLELDGEIKEHDEGEEELIE